MTDDQIEQQIKAKGADKAPRVTPQDLQANIQSEHYFTAEDGVIGAHAAAYAAQQVDTLDANPPDPLRLLTFCVLVLRNGFTVVGKSAVASPENFKPEIGRAVARTDAINQVWPLMGYALKESLHQAKKGD